MEQLAPDPRIAGFERRLRIIIASWLASEHGRAFAHGRELAELPGLFHTLAELAVDDRVPARLRRLALAAVVYVAAPHDLLPEDLIGVSGLVDDLVLCALVLRRLTAELSPAVVTAAWPGEGRLDDVIAVIARDAGDLVGAGLRERLAEWAVD